MTMRRAARLTPLLAVALAGCPAEPPPCPGDPQATLSFSGTVTASSCTDLVQLGAAAGFPATISFLSESQAAVCLSRLLTRPLLCARDGDAIAGCASDAQEVRLAGCPCAVSLVETLSGSLERTGARITGFTGAMLVALDRSGSDSAATCFAAQDALGTTGTCPPAAGSCTVRYDLSGAP